MKKIAVIGAGVAGLASAIRLQKKGYDVTIFEKNATIGGRMGQITKDGFHFDMGPTIVMMPEIYRDVFVAGGVNPEDYIPMAELEQMYSVYYPDGEVIHVSTHFEQTLREFEQVSEDDAEGYLSYMAEMYRRYLVAKRSFILRSFRKRSDFYNPHTLKEALKLKTFTSAYTSISKYVKSEKIRQLLSFQTLYIGLSPFNGPSIYTIIPMIETIYGVWYIKGGMYAMAQAMARLFTELGGKIELSTAVDRIVIENNQVKGVQIGNQHKEFDIVLNTVDFPFALESLLPKDAGKGKYQQGRVEKLDYSCSGFMLYLGVDTAPPEGLPVHNVVFADDFTKNIEMLFAGQLIDRPSIYVYVPSVVDETLAPAGKMGIYVLMPVPNLKDGATIDWQDVALQNKLKDQIYIQLKRIAGLEKIREQVLFEEIFLPTDFKQTFNAYHGAAFGIKPTLLQSNYFRPQPKSPKINGLYFAGSSVHPGAGVPIVLTSAKLAVEEIERDQ